MTTSLEGLDEVIREFLVESTENLDQLDGELVLLETAAEGPDRTALLASIFRTIHTIKGTSGFLAFGQLEKLTHVGETLLAKLRDGKLSLSPSAVDGLLQMVDGVRELLVGVEATGEEPQLDHAELIERLGVLAAADQAVLPAAREPHASESHEPAEVAPEAVAEPVVEAAPAAVAEPTVAPEPETAAAPEQQARTRSVSEASVRVDVELLDDLMRLVGELVLSRNQLQQQVVGINAPSVERATQRLSLITSELQDSVMKTRMQTVEALWAKMPRVVRDLGVQCGKQVVLELEGGDTEVDRTLLEAVKDPLTHLVRNAVDHGLENAEDRIAAGKPAAGSLVLRAYHAGGQVVIDIVDDGKGIDPARIGAAAVEKGLISAEEAGRSTPEQLIDFIFRPGFSTAAAVTNVSGRGVGMDVVRTNIEACGGRVEVTSTIGQGTTIRVTLPLTLAIMPALLVGTAEHLVAVPQSHLLEVVRLAPVGEHIAGEPPSVEYIGGAPVHRLRGELLPLVSLRDVLELPPASSDEAASLLVLQVESCRFGLIVDAVRETQEIVVKPLVRQLRELKIYAGATILGDGAIALILDVGSVARSARLSVGKRPGATEAAAPEKLADNNSDVLIVDLGRGRRGAVPVADVARLEKIPLSTVELADGKEVVQYRDGLLPLLPLGRMLGAGAPPLWETEQDGSTDHELDVLVWERGTRRVGLVVDAIRDVTPADLSAVKAAPRGSGVVDSIVIGSFVTDLLDVASLLESWNQWGEAA